MHVFLKSIWHPVIRELANTSCGGVLSLQGPGCRRHPWRCCHTSMASPRLQSTSPAPKQHTKVVLLGVAGAAVGVVAKTATAPLERVKMLLQVQAMAAPSSTVVASGSAHPHNLRLQYRGGILGTLVEVARAEGPRALFQGNGANCVRIAPAYAVRFGTNDAIKDG